MRVEGIVDSMTQFVDEGVEYTLVHLHSEGLCYDALFDNGRAAAIDILLKKGDHVALTGPISMHEDKGLIISRDIDVSRVEIEYQGEMKAMDVDYKNVYH